MQFVPHSCNIGLDISKSNIASFQEYVFYMIKNNILPLLF